MSIGSPRKVVIVGDFAVGKTSLIHNYIGSFNSSEAQATLGADVLNCHLDIEGSSDKIPCQVWDLSGQQAFAKMRSAFLAKADAAIIVFDVVRSNTFANIEKWAGELASTIGMKSFPVLVIGNKEDLRSEDSVRAEEANEIASILQDTYSFIARSAMTSALNGEGVSEAFRELSSLLILSNEQKHHLG